MYICLLGRQPELSIAELECYFGSDSVRYFSDESAVVSRDDDFDIQRLGGTVKAGRVLAEYKMSRWPDVSKRIVNESVAALNAVEGKITLGISVYGIELSPREVQKTGLILKSKLKKSGHSVRLVPNEAQSLTSASSHHNKLGLSPNKIELLVVYGKKSVIVAESIGTQNITALAARDQARPKTDAFVGMLPPKLALMMVNMGAAPSQRAQTIVLDPFCGTGVVLQEASLLGYNVYGTDHSDKMVEYASYNLKWLKQKYDLTNQVRIEPGDATSHRWKQPIDAVVSETYLGQPFSAPPASDKLEKVRRNVDHIILEFLKNIHTQLSVGTRLCIAVPAWRNGVGAFTHLKTIENLETLGYKRRELTNVDTRKLIYSRDDQIVARQLLLLTAQ